MQRVARVRQRQLILAFSTFLHLWP